MYGILIELDEGIDIKLQKNLRSTLKKKCLLPVTIIQNIPMFDKVLPSYILTTLLKR